MHVIGSHQAVPTDGNINHYKNYTQHHNDADDDVMESF